MFENDSDEKFVNFVRNLSVTPKSSEGSDQKSRDLQAPSKTDEVRFLLNQQREQDKTEVFKKNDLECGEDVCPILVVNKVPHTVSLQCITNLFSEYGEVIHVEKHPGSRYREFSQFFVTMEKLQDARSAAEGIHRRPPLKLSVFRKDSDSLEKAIPKVEDDWQLSEEEDWSEDLQNVEKQNIASLNVDKFFEEYSDDEELFDATEKENNKGLKTEESIEQEKVLDCGNEESCDDDAFSAIEDAGKDPADDFTAKPQEYTNSNSELREATFNENESGFGDALEEDQDGQSMRLPMNEMKVESLATQFGDHGIGVHGIAPRISDCVKKNEEVEFCDNFSDDESFVSANNDANDECSNNLDESSCATTSELPSAEYTQQILPLQIEEPTEITIASLMNFPAKFMILPMKNYKQKKDIESKLRNASAASLKAMKNPRVGSSCLIHKRDRCFRANIISTDLSTVTVELVDQGFDIVEVDEKNVFQIDKDVWTPVSLDCIVSLFIPQNHVWCDEDLPIFRSCLEQEDAVLLAVPEVTAEDSQYVSLVVEKRKQKNIFELMNEGENACKTGATVSKSPNEFDFDPELSDYKPPPLFNIDVPESQEIFDDGKIPEPESEAVAKLEEFPFSHLNERIKHNKIFLDDLAKASLNDSEEYIFMDFGEFSDEAFLLPVYEAEDETNIVRLETVMLESSLYTDQLDHVQVGQVVAAPKQYHSWNKYIRVVVLKVKRDEAKVRGLDYEHRMSVRVSDLRPVPPDSVCIPARSRPVLLDGVARVTRESFKPFLTDLVTKILKKPLTVKMLTGKDDPSIQTPTVELFCSQVDNVKVNILIQDELDKPVKEVDIPVVCSQQEDLAYKLKCILKTNFKCFPTLEEGTELEIVILHTHSPSLMTVLPAEDLDKLYNKIGKYNKLAADRPPLDKPCRPGQICLSRSGEDGMWYRSLVLSIVSTHQVRVLLVDLGSIIKVPVVNIKSLKQSNSYQFCAYLCQLTEDWNTDVEEVWANVKTGKQRSKVGGLKCIEWKGKLSDLQTDQNSARFVKEEVRKVVPRYSQHLVKVVRQEGCWHTITLLPPQGN